MARRGGKDRGLIERPKGSGIWWIRYADATGHERREKAGAKSLARKLYEKRKTEIREARYFPPERRRVILVREILDDYKQWAETAGRSVIKGKPAYERLYNAFGDKPAETLPPTEVDNFKAALSQTLKPASVNRHLVVLKAAYNRAIRASKLKGSPIRDVKLFKENNIRVRYLTEKEEKQLVTALPAHLQPLIVAAVHTGMRRGELLALRWDDVDFSARVLTVCKSKSGEGRRMPINDVVFKTLGRLFLERSKKTVDDDGQPQGAQGLVFTAREGGYLQNLNRAWYPALLRAELTDFHFHDLRHTFASRLVMAGVDLYTVQILLGHKTPEMVQRYAHLSSGHLRQAVERLTAAHTPLVPSAAPTESNGANNGGSSSTLH